MYGIIGLGRGQRLLLGLRRIVAFGILLHVWFLGILWLEVWALLRGLGRLRRGDSHCGTVRYSFKRICMVRTLHGLRIIGKTIISPCGIIFLILNPRKLSGFRSRW